MGDAVREDLIDVVLHHLTKACAFAPLAVALCAAEPAHRAAAQTPTPTPTTVGRPVRGTTVEIEGAGAVSWDTMRRSEARRRGAAAPSGEPQVVPILPGPPARQLRREAAATNPVMRSVDSVTAAPAPNGLAVTGGFAALGDDNTRIPPDTMGAVGPSHLVTMLNTQVRVQDKDGGVLGTVSLTAFWTTAPSTLSGSPFDPRIAYDVQAGRWIAIAAANAASTTSAVWLAISDTSDPTGVWKFFSIKGDTTTTPITWVDFPTLGFNQTWIAVTANMFTIAGSGFAGAKMWVIDKASALAAMPTLTVTVFPNAFDLTAISLGPPPTPPLVFTGFTLQPALTFGNEAKLYLVDNPLLSLIEEGGATTKLLRLSEITGSGAAPVWSPTAGSPFVDTDPIPGSTGLFSCGLDFNPNLIGAEQMGVASTCSGGPLDGQACLTSADCIPPPPTPVPPAGACRRVDTGDSRLAAAQFRNGHVWTANAAGLPASALADRTVVFWYQIDPTALATTPVVQSGTLDGGAGVHHFYPSIAVNQNDDACVGFSRSSSGTFIEAVASGRLGSDPPGTFAPISLLKAGEGPYVKTGASTRNRWGDYSATAVDPADDTTLWTLQQHAAAPVSPTPGSPSSRWGTWWGRKAPPTSTSTATGTATPTQTATPTPTPQPDLAGSVRYYRDDRPVPGVTMNLGGGAPQSTLTEAAGGYLFADVPAAVPLLTPAKLGDFDDGIGSLDSAFVSQRVVGSRTFDAYQELACDVTGNGAISSLDAARIVQLRLGIISRFPVSLACGSDWLFLPMPSASGNPTVIEPQIGGGACTLGSLSYDPLQTPAAGQDFIAVLFGDCTGNWASVP